MASKRVALSSLGPTKFVEQNSLCQSAHVCMACVCVRDRESHFSDIYAKGVSVII